MAAFSPSADKLITSATGKLGDALPVDGRDVLARLLLDLGFSQITGSNTPPTDQSVLWWHIDVKQAKRYNPALGNWFALTPNQHSMHLFQRLIAGAGVEVTLDDNDTLAFWDVSAVDGKKVTVGSLSAQVIRRLTVGRRFYYNTAGGPLTHTLPAAPSDGDTVQIYDKGGNFKANNLTIGRNGKTIKGSATDLICDVSNVTVELQFIAADGDWRITLLARSFA
ncbi:hypothetical protein [Shinella granuli]|uniref:Uncharacterized protein n=1 Tax=Shinella granuli TaxID=323621 RepID=A0A4R2CK49_SHIGR|nr:hypothetical protein [Shinella granuli]TCN41437.1 hypothetical protein EV665_11322 [Shinella granuli]